MNPLIVVEILRQLGKFGGSWRKEAIGLGAITPAVVSIYGTLQEHCIEICTAKSALFAVSGQQYAALIGALVVLVVHLYAKRNESLKAV